MKGQNIEEVKVMKLKDAICISHNPNDDKWYISAVNDEKTVKTLDSGIFIPDCVVDLYEVVNYENFLFMNRENSASVYQTLACRTINNELNATQLEHHALHGMSGEVGELHSLYQKIYQGHKFDEEHAKKELGDLLWFVAEYCTANGWMLEEIMQMNIDKLKARFPEGFEVDKSLNRKEGDI